MQRLLFDAPLRRARLSWLLLGLVVASGPSTSGPLAAQDPCQWSRDLRLVNGRIHTMDSKNSIVAEVSVQNGRIVGVGPIDGPRLSPCTRTIDLGGRAAIPGLIDNHNHIVLLGMRPGHDVRLERSFSIADVQSAIRSRAQGVGGGQFVTAMGGWGPGQFVEKRNPTLAELDAAAPKHPVILYQGFQGPAVTNTLGKTFFEGRGVTVGDVGVIASGAAAVAALNALRSIQTFDDQKRGTAEALSYAASLGLTTNVDQGFNIVPETPDIGASHAEDGLASLNPWTAYDAVQALHREQKLATRVRLFIYTQDTAPDTPLLKQRLLNHFANFGDDMLRVSGIGEQAVAWNAGATPIAPNFEAALKLIAAHGWAFHQHSLTLNEARFIADTFEAVNRTTPIADLRWALDHARGIDEATVNRLKAVGAGIAVHPGGRYLGGGSGPPFRMILASGVRVGVGSDAAQVTALDPWAMIYYMVTGRNAGGELVNDPERISREEAIRLYTAANGWFTREENVLGSIEPGKFADLAVLSADFFDPKQVPDEAIRTLRSVLTIVDGRVVHDAMR
jgi:predicted amidohydrolase YtcJ